MTDRIRTALEQHTGALEEAELVTDRRGIQVWRVTATGGPVAAPGQRLAVKIPDRAGLIAARREVAALEAIGAQTRNPRSPLIDGGTFTVAPWFDGPSTATLFRAARYGADLPTPGQLDMRAAAAHYCRAVAELHHLGWVHGDLQAAHCIHTESGPRLIDLTNAQGPRQLSEPELNTPFTGGLAHLEAPELAAPLGIGRSPVPTYASDVYALAASLWAAATGAWPLNYQLAGLDPSTVGTSDLRVAIGTGTIPLATSTVWPELLAVLAAALVPASNDRPTAAQLGDAIDAL
ncbi:hypothetical protein ACFVVX_27430 [Kitasatospora sp. NPDC058170]|uniref:hypothetical protein n=1 Tax=Kitasatospora sp. NPDC058170 TaxID=3346364 RepID=UPI0036D84D8E